MLRPVRLAALLVAWGCTGGTAAHPDGGDGHSGAATADTGSSTPCVPLARHPDADGDGFGAADAVDVCPDAAGFVDDGTDCDDGAAGVHPGADPACDDHDDDDCDGAVDPQNLDGDLDGATGCDGDCDDADPVRRPGAQEICGGGDRDCDGLVDRDDGTVDLWTCGDCESEANYDASLLIERKINPCLHDTDISLCDPATDTETHGERLHRVILRNDGLPFRDELFLFLPPGPGNQNDQILNWAAFSGYRVLSLGWQNELRFNPSCSDSPCFEELHHEHQDGTDASPIVTIPPSDSVDGRFQTALEVLAAEHPEEGWPSYLLPDGTVDYSRVVLMGWSGGAAQAGYFTRGRAFKAALLISGPMETLGSPYAFVDWISTPSAVPECGMFGLYHRHEPGGGVPGDSFHPGYNLLGIPGDPVDLDTNAPPYDGAQMFNTATAGVNKARDCNAHKTTAMDGCMDPSFMRPFYFHAYCALPRACDAEAAPVP